MVCLGKMTSFYRTELMASQTSSCLSQIVCVTVSLLQYLQKFHNINWNLQAKN